MAGVASVRICPFCNKLQSADAARCADCGRRLPPEWQVGVSRGLANLGERYGVTALFVAVSVGVYLALTMGGAGLLQGPNARLALRWGALAGTLGMHEPWRYLSAMFVHLNLMHVAFNTLALHSLGRSVEVSFGWARFTLIFLGTGIIGFIASQLWYQLMYGAHPITGGISGGLFGLLGAGIGWRYAERDPEWRKLAINGIGYAVIMALIPGISVNHAAHLGGLAGGAAFGWAFHRLPRRARSERSLQRVALALIIGTFASIALSWVSPAVPARRRLTLSSIVADERALDRNRTRGLGKVGHREAADPRAADPHRARILIDAGARGA